MARSAVDNCNKTTLKSTVSCHKQIQAFQTLSGSRSCLAHAPTTNSTAPWSVTGEVQTFDPSTPWSTSDQKQHKYHMDRESTTRKEWCRTLSCSRWYQHNVTQDTMNTVELQFVHAELVPHALLDATSTSERSSGNSNTRESSTLHSTSCLSRSSNFQVSSPPGQHSSALPRSCVHGAVTRLWNHTLISPVPSSCRFRSTPQLSSTDHAASNPSSRKR